MQSNYDAHSIIVQSLVSCIDFCKLKLMLSMSILRMKQQYSYIVYCILLHL